MLEFSVYNSNLVEFRCWLTYLWDCDGGDSRGLSETALILNSQCASALVDELSGSSEHDDDLSVLLLMFFGKLLFVRPKIAPDHFPIILEITSGLIGPQIELQFCMARCIAKIFSFSIQTEDCFRRKETQIFHK